MHDPLRQLAAIQSEGARRPDDALTLEEIAHAANAGGDDPLRYAWDVFDANGCLEIERTDSPDDPPEDYGGRTFLNDDEAVAYVFYRATRMECPEARKAIREITESWED